MKFRPCIDIHNGKVKQIVGGTLSDNGPAAGSGKDSGGEAAGRTDRSAGETAKSENQGPGEMPRRRNEQNGHSSARENFTSEKDAAYFAELYRKHGLTGGHIILLNPKGTPEYEADLRQAESALRAWPEGMQIGGGMNAENGAAFIEKGASHIIVTSAIFDGPKLCLDRVQALARAVGREHLVIDLSCRRKADGKYYVVTDRWQTFTDLEVGGGILDRLAEYCDEFLIHGVDAEGLGAGFEEDLIRILAAHRKNPVTYAGGIASLEDIRKLAALSEGRLDFTVGSALDLFGGQLPFEDVVRCAAAY